MTVNYLKICKCKEDAGRLSDREFQNAEVDKQVTLKTEVYGIFAPFNVEEYFDATSYFSNWIGYLNKMN